MKIYASKSYPELSYMVDTQKILYSILSTGYIFTSAEENVKNPTYRYVSLSRDLPAAARRNPKRWKYGVIFDGTRLTDRYLIEPFSYGYHAYDSSKRILVVKSLTLYDNGDCVLTLLNHPSKLIPRMLYNELREIIVTDAQGINDLKKLEKRTGSRIRNGRKIVEQFVYNVPAGGIRLNSGVLSDSGASLLLKHTGLNETEERLYVHPSTTKVAVDFAINGILVPEDEEVDEPILNLCETYNWAVKTY